MQQFLKALAHVVKIKISYKLLEIEMMGNTYALKARPFLYLMIIFV